MNYTKEQQQKYFDKVVKHLRKQGKKSMQADGYCMYRGPDNTRCAIGALIPNRLYRKKMDTGANFITKILKLFPTVFKHFGEPDTEAQQFLSDLQAIHDGSPTWESEFSRFATRYDLVYKEPVK